MSQTLRSFGLTKKENNMCQYCASKDREMKALRSELNDAYLMLDIRDREVKKLKNKKEKENA